MKAFLTQAVSKNTLSDAGGSENVLELVIETILSGRAQTLPFAVVPRQHRKRCTDHSSACSLLLGVAEVPSGSQEPL